MVGVELPSKGAEDSISFLPAFVDKKNDQRRTSLVSHSNHGEFAYREGPWKIVFKMSGKNLQQSRGKPTILELYNLDTDIGEQNELSKKHPEIVERMTRNFQKLIDQGSSRSGQKSANDTKVRFDISQEVRWTPAS